VAQIELFLQLAFLLSIAVVTHFLMKILRQPTIVGEIGIGIVLGPTILGYFVGGPDLIDRGLVELFATLGAIFLLFILGLESDVRALFRRRNVLIAIGGVILPWVAGFGLAFLLVPAGDVPNGESGRFAMAVFTGAALVATSTAIAAAVLLELGKAKSEVASVILGAAVVDDILALFVLSLAKGVASPTGIDLVGFGVVITSAVLFVVVGVFLGLRFFSPMVTRIHRRGQEVGLPTAGFMVCMAVAFVYALAAEVLGLSAIIGAFIAGAMFARTPLRESLAVGAGYLSAVFTPIFFISLGLLVNLWAVGGNLFLFAALLAGFAILTKVVGCGVPARLTGMTRRESLVVGTAMAPRGEMGLVIALAAVSAGVIGDSLYSIIVVVMIVVSVVPTPFLRRLLKGMDQEARVKVAPPASPPGPPRAGAS